MLNTFDPLESLTHDMDTIGDIEPPAGMWDRLMARIEAEEAAAPARRSLRLRLPSYLRGLVLVPTR